MKKRCFIIGAGAFDGFLTDSKDDKFNDSLTDSKADRFNDSLTNSKTDKFNGLQKITKTRDNAETPEKAAQAPLLTPEPGDLIIAADGGYRYLQELGIEPDILMGDFDSLEIVPEHRHLIRHSPIKDDTDMALAVAWAEEAGCEFFFLYGGLGGRLDHTLANLQLLTGMARKGLEAYLIGQGNILTAITDGKLEFPAQATGMISVFCQGEQAAGVFERGLKYTLEDAVLTCDRALGVSNEFTGVPGSIMVKAGTLLVLWDDANGLPKRGACT